MAEIPAEPRKAIDDMDLAWRDWRELVEAPNEPDSADRRAEWDAALKALSGRREPYRRGVGAAHREAGLTHVLERGREPLRELHPRAVGTIVTVDILCRVL